MRRPSPLAILSFLLVSLFAGQAPALAQNRCNNALPIQVDVAAAFDTSGLTASSIPWRCGSNGYADTWFVYDAPATQTLIADVCEVDCQIEILTGSCTGLSLVGCDERRCLYAGTGIGSSKPIRVVAGASYWFRLAARFPGPNPSIAGSLTLRPHVPPANDECEQAQVLLLDVPVAVDAFEASLSPAPGICGLLTRADLWYSFTPPTTGLFRASTCDSVSGSTRVEVLDGACGGLTSVGCTETFCSPGSGATQTFVGTAGVTVLIRVYSSSLLPTQTGILLVTEAGSSANDECGTALPIALGQTVATDTIPATSSPEAWSCDANGSEDIWYAFVAPRDGLYALSMSDRGYDAVVGFYSGICGALTEVDCGFGSVPTGLNRVAASALAGETLLIRVGGTSVNQRGRGKASLEVLEVPSNDSCDTAQPLALDAPVAFDTNLASMGPEAWSCSLAPTGTQAIHDIWYSFTAPADGTYRASTCGTPGVPYVEVRLGNCSSSTPVTCAYDFDCVKTGAGFDLAAGEEVLIRIGLPAFNGPTVGLVEVEVDPRPGNDECDAPMSIGLGATPYDLTFATRSFENAGCTNNPIDDVFYTFVAPSSGRYRARSCGVQGIEVNVLRGTCDSVTGRFCGLSFCDQIGTTGAGATSYFQGIAGETYTVQVGHPDGALAGSGILELETLPGPAFDNCAGAVSLAPGTTPFDGSFAAGNNSADCDVDYSADVWFRYDAPQTGSVDVSLCGLTYPAVVDVIADTGSCGSGALLECSRYSPFCSLDGVLGPAVTFPVSAGSGYLIRISGFMGTSGSGSIDLVEAFAANGGLTGYCAAAPNSTGSAASLTGVGNTSLIANDLTLRTDDLPSGSFGFYLASQAQGFTAMPGGSQGNLCLAGSIGRYVGPGQIQAASSFGTLQLEVSLYAIPQPTQSVLALRGETWNWQLWYRDALGGVATSNFSNGLSGLIQ